jgi:serine/threonine protein phosphatase 1
MKPEPHLPERLPHRTNLDTGAYFTGVLSVGVFDDAIAGGPLEILSITAP